MDQSMINFNNIRFVPLALAAAMFLFWQSSLFAADRYSCLQQHRAYVQVVSKLPSSASTNAYDIITQVRDVLQSEGLTLIDPDMADQALKERQERMVAMGDVVGALELAKEIKATLLVNVRVNGTQRQIRGMAAGLYTVSTQVEMQATATADGKVLGSVRNATRKPGLDIDSQLPVLLDNLLPGMSDKLITKVCNKTKAAAPIKAAPVEEPAESVDTGASQLDSL